VIKAPGRNHQTPCTCPWSCFCAREAPPGSTLRPQRCLAVARVPCYTESVANLTLSVDDEILKRARMRALEQGTSVNAILAERLQAFAREGGAQARATQTLIELAKENRRGTLGAERRRKRRWSRDELHER